MLAYSEKISTQERIRREILAIVAGFGEKILTMTSREILIDSWETAFKTLLPNELKELLQRGDESIDDFLNVVNLKALQNYSGLEALQKFTERGIKLLPTHDTGAFICKKEFNQQYETSDIETIKAYRNRGFKLFRFLPKDYKLLVVDIDVGHSNNVNGFDEFYENLAKKGVKKSRLPDVLRDLNNGSYPCYTSTPSGGVHLYFSYEGEDIKKKYLCKNVEVFHATSRITAPGGSKEGQNYILHGNLDDIIPFPDILRDLLTKEIAPKIIPKQDYVQNRTNEKRKYTLDEIFGYVLQDHSVSGNNEFCFRFALRARTGDYTQNEIINFLKSNDKTRNHEQIKPAVNSAFRYQGR